MPPGRRWRTRSELRTAGGHGWPPGPEGRVSTMAKKSKKSKKDKKGKKK
jgi:hypothetical protein